MLDIANHIVKFPDSTLQFKNKNGKFTCGSIALRAAQKITIQPMQQLMIVEEAPAFAQKSELLVSPALVKLGDGITTVQVTNTLDHVCTVNYGTVNANSRSPRLTRPKT